MEKKSLIEVFQEKYKEKYQENLKKQEAFEKRQKEFLLWQNVSN